VVCEHGGVTRIDCGPCSHPRIDRCSSIWSSCYRAAERAIQTTDAAYPCCKSMSHRLPPWTGVRSLAFGPPSGIVGAGPPIGMPERISKIRGGSAVTIATFMHWTANRRKMVVLTILTFITMC
jgi:hypothetical protein